MCVTVGPVATEANFASNKVVSMGGNVCTPAAGDENPFCTADLRRELYTSGLSVAVAAAEDDVRDSSLILLDP